jgi:hypothetical protein
LGVPSGVEGGGWMVARQRLLPADDDFMSVLATCRNGAAFKHRNCGAVAAIVLYNTEVRLSWEMHESSRSGFKIFGAARKIMPRFPAYHVEQYRLLVSGFKQGLIGQLRSSRWQL